MSRKLRNSRWLPALLVAALVVLTGARLITLSAHQRAEQQRAAAQSAAARQAHFIEAQLQALADRTRSEARRALDSGAAAVVPAHNAFWMKSDGTVLRARAADSDVSQALASEWESGDHTRDAGAGFFGPVRYGSQWWVAVQVPIGSPRPHSAAGSATSVVGYEGLQELLLQSRFPSLAKEGYQYELTQLDPASRRLRVFLSSHPESLAEPATSDIDTPVLFPAAVRTPYLRLGLRPRAGWYPARELLTGIGVLALVAWTLGFGTHDLTSSLGRMRSALAVTRRRLHVVHERLSTEIEEHQTLQRSLEHARYHDAFTGLPNRRYFMDQLDRALRELRGRRRHYIAVLLIDIDRFKLVNDTLGHTAGDELMLQAAQRFEKKLAGLECVLARWGGDQLALLAYDRDSAATQALATTLLDLRHEPFALRQHRISVTTHIGFTCTDSGLQRPEEALREADIALAVAKRGQSTLTVAYTPGLGGEAVSLVSLEADLHIALDRNEFRLLFQPIIDLRARRVVGAEALLRWRHPIEGLLTPDKFLALAEESGVIVPLTRWVIRRVARLAGQWRQRLPAATDFYISVNLSAGALRDRELPDYIAHVLRDMGAQPRHLKCELNEGGLVNNVSTAREVLGALHSMGVGLMLDDFGTGYSSLSYLQLFPFDYVKIDRPFVRRTGSERANNAITSAILQMTSSLGLRAIAEVVETPSAAQALLKMGCEFGQGYYFSAPVEAEEALQQLRHYAGPPLLSAAVPVVANDTARDRGAADHARTIVLADGTTLVLADAATLMLPDTPTLVLPESPTLELSELQDATVELEAEPPSGT